jgi:hypothetical protein
MSLRTLLLLLIMLNLVAFAGGQMGWLGGTDWRGEPERLTNQIRPDLITLGSRAEVRRPVAQNRSQPAPTIAPPPQAATIQPESARCAAYIVRGPAGLGEAKGLADASGSTISYSQQTLEEPANWRVRIPPAASLDAAEQRLKTLQARGITDMYLMRGEGPNQWSISLGLYSAEASAEQRLSALRGEGVNSAEIVPGSIGRYWIEFRGPSEPLEALASRMEAILGPDSRRACAP